jgi:hypothetical protein
MSALNAFSPLSGGSDADARSADVASAPPGDAAEASRRARRELAERISTKLHALFWLAAAAAVATWGGLWAALTSDARAERWLLYLAAAAGSAAVSIGVYLVLWVGSSGLAWEVAAPWAVPSATAAGITALLCTIAGVWPIYGLLSPLVVGVAFLGALFSAHFIPSP